MIGWFGLQATGRFLLQGAVAAGAAALWLATASARLLARARRRTLLARAEVTWSPGHISRTPAGRTRGATADEVEVRLPVRRARLSAGEVLFPEPGEYRLGLLNGWGRRPMVVCAEPI